MIAWQVSVSEDFPQGLKYSFQYMDANGDTLLRFDNSPYHLDVGRHHRHTPKDDIQRLRFKGLPNLIKQFQTEVDKIYAQRSD